MIQFFRSIAYYTVSIFELLLGFENPLLIVLIFLDRAGAGIKTVRLRKTALQFRVRGAMDIWSIKETFLDRFYEKYGYPIQPGWSIVDIGAGLGDYTIFAATRQNAEAGQVFAFEPFPESFTLMQENLGLNKINNIHIFPEAIAAESGELVLDLAGEEPLQFQSHNNKVNEESCLHVRSISLAEAFDKTEIGLCDFLKLDCEGAEYGILFAAPPSLFKRIKRIVMEYHDDVTPYSHRDLQRFLDEQGFLVEIFPNPVHATLGYLRAMQREG